MANITTSSLADAALSEKDFVSTDFEYQPPVSHLLSIPLGLHTKTKVKVEHMVCSMDSLDVMRFHIDSLKKKSSFKSK
jgi:hypothetical protein